MGRSITPKYAVEFYGVSCKEPGRAERAVGWTQQAWNCRQAGRPTNANLAAFIKQQEEATLPGGVNAHLGVTTIGSALIKYNYAGGNVVAEYRRFQGR